MTSSFKIKDYLRLKSIIEKVRNVKLQIAGLTKTTLLDFPGIVAATIFIGGCNFRCPFCHNGHIAVSANNCSYLDENEVMEHLVKRKNVLQGLCISGGEPTLQRDLEDFIIKIRELGYRIKLDTNGSNPAILKKLIDKGLIDYIAMDIKNSPDKYELTAGCRVNISNIYESVDLILNSDVEYEFRTTVVRPLHSKDDFLKIDELISGAKKYFIQSYKDSPNVLKEGMSAYTKDELLELINDMKNVNPILRGID